MGKGQARKVWVYEKQTHTHTHKQTGKEKNREPAYFL